MQRDGSRGNAGPRLAPFVFAGVSIAHPRLFDGAPAACFSLNTLWDRSIAAGRLYGLRLEGTWMHVGTPDALAEAEAVISEISYAEFRLMAANVFTLPPGVPFLEAVACAILEGDLPAPGGIPPDPLSLPKITLLLPTRRAARAAREAFLKVSGARAIVMPRIQPISEGERDLSLIASLAEEGASGVAALEAAASHQLARQDVDADAARRDAA